MRKLRRAMLVEVTFTDVESDPSWKDEAERMLSKPPICHCIGWVDHQDSEILYLCTMISQRQGDLTKIPIGCIKEVWGLSYIGKEPVWRKK